MFRITIWKLMGPNNLWVAGYASNEENQHSQMTNQKLAWTKDKSGTKSTNTANQDWAQRTNQRPDFTSLHQLKTSLAKDQSEVRSSSYKDRNPISVFLCSFACGLHSRLPFHWRCLFRVAGEMSGNLLFRPWSLNCPKDTISESLDSKVTVQNNKLDWIKEW